MILPYVRLSLIGKPSWKRVVQIKIKNGKKKYRTQFKPNDALRKIHADAERILKQKMGEYGIEFQSATAFIKRKSGIQKHFQRHVNQSGFFNQYWFATDLKNAYGSVKIRALANIIFQMFPLNINPYEKFTDQNLWFEEYLEVDPPKKRLMQYSEIDIRYYLQDYFANPDIKDGLAEGFPLSPFLFNLYCEVVLDQQLRDYCEKHQISYSRFADDLIFSSDTPIGVVKKKTIKKIIGNWFEINQQKTTSFDINRYPQGVVMNGCLLRNTKHAEMLPLGSRRKEFHRLVHLAYIKGVAHKEFLAGKFGVIKQRTLALGPGHFDLPKSLKDDLLHYFFFKRKKSKKSKVGT